MRDWLHFLAELFPAPWRIFGFLFVIIAGYDGVSNQADLPKLHEFVPGLAGSMTWWGWLLLLQAAFLLALANYVRNHRHMPPADQGKMEARAKMEGREVPAAKPAARQVQSERPPSSPIKSKPVPDVTLRDVMRRIAQTDQALSDLNDFKTLMLLSKEIMDKVQVHSLAVWGRSGNKPIDRIVGSEWRSATLQLDKQTVFVRGPLSTYEYADIKFYSAQVDEIWPPLKT